MKNLISLENLGIAIPQRSAINASKEELAGVFHFDSIVARRGTTVDTNLEEQKTTEDLTSLQVRLKSAVNNRIFVMSLRQFIGLPEAPAGMAEEDIAKSLKEGDREVNFPVDDKIKPLYNSLMESKEDDKPNVALPTAIKFAYIRARKSADGTKDVYPASLYKDFQNRVEKERATHMIASPDKPFTLDNIYSDYSFMSGLENGVLVNPNATPEAQKILVISRIEE